jgi:muramoyltetrapeptide carboxypeptidase
MLPSAMTLRWPPALVPGDVVAVVAPSSPFPLDALWPGLGWLRQRYRLRMLSGSLEREGYLAGSDARRAAELAQMMTDPQVRAIVAVRGGYGAMRIAGALPWQAFARDPRWLVGFSDITALHVLAWGVGVGSVHGPNVTGLGRQATPAIRAAWLAALERPHARRAWDGLRVIRAGEAAGPIFGGNLALLHAMAAAGRLALPRGAVLAIEDVTEAPYRVDRMLTSLRLGGHFAGLSAVVLGGFDRCAPGPDGRTVDDVLGDRLGDLGVPVLAGAPFGHGDSNEAFVLGSPVRIDGGRVLFR